MTSFIESWIESALDSEDADVEQLKNIIAKRIEVLTNHNDISKKDLAKKLNVSAPYVSKLLGGDANLSIKTLVKVARAFECEVQIDFIVKGSGCTHFQWETMKKNRVDSIPSSPTNSDKWMRRENVQFGGSA